MSETNQPEFTPGLRELHALDPSGKSVKHIATTEGPVQTQEELLAWYQALAATNQPPEGSQFAVLEPGDPRFVNGKRPEPRPRQTGESLGVEAGRVEPQAPGANSLLDSDVDINHDANANPTVKAAAKNKYTAVTLDDTTVLAVQKGIFEKRTAKSQADKARLVEHVRKFKLD